MKQEGASGKKSSDLYPLIFDFLSSEQLKKTLKTEGSKDSVDLFQIYTSYLTANFPTKGEKNGKKKSKRKAEEDEKKESKKHKKEAKSEGGNDKSKIEKEEVNCAYLRSKVPQEQPMEAEAEKLEENGKKEKKKKKKHNKYANTETEPQVEEPKQEGNEQSEEHQSDENQETPSKEMKMKKQNEPFRRIRPEDVEIDPRLADNSFWSKGGDEWGVKANEDLIKTRGKGFRHAKTKKKKGTYKGGSIDMRVNSVKFHYSDEEQ